MQLAEFEALQRVEREHWFYLGKRLLTEWWIRRAADLGLGATIADVGAGTGELVRHLRSEFAGAAVIGIEYAEAARTIARTHNGIELVAGSVLDLPLDTAAAQVSIALDVLEHVEHDQMALSELIRVTAAGGLILINVPAFESLWSEWDVSLGHHRRYSMTAFEQLLTPHTAEIEIISLRYMNEALFIPIWLYRRASRLLRLKSRAEDHVPSPMLNRILLWLFLTPAKQGWMRAPFGVSIYAVLRRK